MAGVNKVILVGNLGNDPEVATIDSGVKRASFSVATTESFKNKNGDRTEHTEWHRVTVWRGLADVAEKYLRKGSKVYVEGRIRSREYTDKDNIKRYFTDIIADNFQMLDRADNNGAGGGYQQGGQSQQQQQQQQQQTPSAQQPVAEENPEDDLPF